MPASEALEKNIHDRIRKLEKVCDHITSCNVVVEEAHHHKHQGKLFHVRINLHVPDKELIVSREKHDKQEHEDPYVAVRDAFNAMQRQVEDYSKKHKGDRSKRARRKATMVADGDMDGEEE